MKRNKRRGRRWMQVVVDWLLHQGVKLLVLAVLGFLFWILWPDRRMPRLIVYCAHDAVFADAVLDEFERQTGIMVVVQYDTEATKSLGLVQKIAAERQRPRCDVFWNNEQLGTMWLAEQGALE